MTGMARGACESVRKAPCAKLQLTWYARVVLCTPLDRLFDYQVPPHWPRGTLQPGMRVKVPFGRRIACVAVVVDLADSTDVPSDKIKRLLEVLDQQPLLAEPVLRLCRWASQYYHEPLGEVLFAAMPPSLRAGERAALAATDMVALTDVGRAKCVSDFKRSPKQALLWQLLSKQSIPIAVDGLLAHGISKAVLQALQARGDAYITEVLPDQIQSQAHVSDVVLSDAQAVACDAIMEAQGFSPFVLQGVTGSGKTEVYFQVIAKVLAKGGSALVVVPEIALTPQMIARFNKRFDASMVVLHSGLNATERCQAWLQAATGRAAIVVGTRSAIFVPMPDLALIVMDEEHDPSFKQQSGFRYSARDVAMVRAKQAGIPIVLGSATPSLETLWQMQGKQYQALLLPERVGGASMPAIELVDCRHQVLVHGLAPCLRQAMADVLASGQQVLVFLNRRGYAPSWQCQCCGWVAMCERCDTAMVLHQNPKRLLCHHCEASAFPAKRCGSCHGEHMAPIGVGTGRLEEHLSKLFPEVPVLRVDRDSTRRKGSLDAMLAKIMQGGPQILLGTQMLAKGHHFPHVTMVAILHVDSGLFSVDFRATERLGQLIVQVAGRAGRALHPGRVYLQTYQPHHPLLKLLLQKGYAAFAKNLLAERQQAGLPPYRYMALLHASDTKLAKAEVFLKKLRLAIVGDTKVQCLGPIPAPLAMRDKRYRFQLMLLADDRAERHRAIWQIRQVIAALPLRQRVRWDVDVDPLDMA